MFTKKVHRSKGEANIDISVQFKKEWQIKRT